MEAAWSSETSQNLHRNTRTESENYFTAGSLPPINWSWRTAFFFFQLNTYGYSPYLTSSLTRRMGLSFTIAAGRRQCKYSRIQIPQDSRHILLSQIRDPPNLENQVRIFISSGAHGAPVIVPGTGCPFRPLLRLAVLRWRYSSPVFIRIHS
jgi:hypothetical protein